MAKLKTWCLFPYPCYYRKPHGRQCQRLGNCGQKRETDQTYKELINFLKEVKK